jgi:hypothetical protein
MKGDVETYYADGQWRNKVEGEESASSTHDTKKEARKIGRRLAKIRRVEHVIKKKDGTIKERNSHGNDPHPPKG